MPNDEAFMHELQSETCYLFESKYLCEVQSLERVAMMTLEPLEREEAIQYHLKLVELIDELIHLGLLLISSLKTMQTVDDEAYGVFVKNTNLVKTNLVGWHIENRERFKTWVKESNFDELDR